MKSRSNLKEMMNKIGILAFYIDIGNLEADEVDGYIESIVNELDPKLDNMEDENNPLHYWERFYIPVRNSNTRIQVIRNDGQSDTGEISLSDLKEQLYNFEMNNFKEEIDKLKSEIEELKSIKRT